MNHPEWIARNRLNRWRLEKILLGLLFVLCLGVAVKTIGVFFQNHAVAATIAESAKCFENHNGKAKEYLDMYSKKAEKLKEKGVFCLEKKETPPQVTGILGDRVLMNDKWCRVEEEHAGAKVLVIEPTQVTIFWHGKEMKLAPLLASVPGNPTEPQNNMKKDQNSAAGNIPPKTKMQAAVAPAVEEDPLAWLGMEVSGGLRAFLLKLFEAMPADQVENAKKEWTGMSDEQKKQRLNEAQQMVDSGQADKILEQAKANKG